MLHLGPPGAAAADTLARARGAMTGPSDILAPLPPPPPPPHHGTVAAGVEGGGGAASGAASGAAKLGAAWLRKLKPKAKGGAKMAMVLGSDEESGESDDG